MPHQTDPNGPALNALLPPAIVTRLRGAAQLISYEDGQLIHSRGDDKPGVSIVRSGAVQITSIGRDGRQITVSEFGPGYCFGEQTLFAGLPRTHDVFAVGNTKVDQITGPAFMAVFNTEPDLARALLIMSQLRTHSLLDQMDDMRRLPLAVRTAKTLRGLVPQGVAAATITLRQTELAYRLGVSRVSIGKTLKALERKHLLRLGYGHIHLPDTHRLTQWIASRSSVASL